MITAGTMRLTDLMVRAAHHWPNQPALTCDSGTLPWAQLSDRVHRLASVLRAAGVGCGDRVAWLGFNGRRGVECYYAPLLLGAASVPLNFRLAEAELLSAVQISEPKVLIADAEHAGIARTLTEQSGIQLCLTAEYEDRVAQAPPLSATEAAPGANDDMAMLLFTGGTTGQAKGVMLSHANLYVNAMGTAMGFAVPFARHEAHLMTGPLFHTAAGGRVWMSALMGTHLVMMAKFDVENLMMLVTDHRVSLLQLVPTMLAMILDHPKREAFDLSCLRILTYGAAPMPPDMMRRAMQAFPGITFGQAYGMTEAAPIVTVLDAKDHEGEAPHLTSVGRPVPYDDVRILDAGDKELPHGQVGEVCLRGPNVMLGYWRDDATTATAMRGGWYHTGDTGYVDGEGYIYLTGRMTDMIITGGENVYPIEVENAVGSHPSVDEVAVIGLPDPKWGERVHAVVRLKGRAGVNDIIDHCQGLIAGYKCPKSVSFLDGPFPLTTVNKIDKKALREMYLPRRR
jgi:acyl-CoA synthetase (AMP-forming)/AMP-acid ligase II